MKKTYQRPALICEELHPETMLCACDYVNEAMNEEWHCAFDPGLGDGIMMFAQNWDNCKDKTAKYGNIQFCVQGPQVHVFSKS